MFDFLIILSLGSVALYWWKSSDYKDRALQYAYAYCRELRLQLLDQSMVIRGIWPIRVAGGKLALRRTYQFEFSSTGEHRHKGALVLIGMDLQDIHLDAYQIPDSDL